MLREKEKIFNRFIAVIEVLIAWISFKIVLFIQFHEFSPMNDKDEFIVLTVIALVWFTLGRYYRISKIHRSRPYSIILYSCAVSVATGTIILALTLWILDIYTVAARNIVYFALIDLFLMFSFKYVVYHFFKEVRKRGRNACPIVIMGDWASIRFIEKVKKNTEWGYKIVAIIGDNIVTDKYKDEFLVLPIETTDINELLENKTIDELVFIADDVSMIKVQKLVHSCSEVGVIFRMYSPIFNMLRSKAHIHHYNTMPLLTISNAPTDYLPMKVKNIIDFVIASCIVLIGSPVFLGIALAIALGSKGPIFFKQKRVGLRGRKFWVYKFRTMVVNAEELKSNLAEENEMDGPVFKMKNDPRITKIGKFLRKTSLDELPQFFNVLLGDMSIVGPRPPVPAEVQKYERWQLRRLSMKPGITCTWQISGRNEISFEDWMRMDLDYIDNWSLGLDFVIFLKTIKVIFVADGH